MRTMISHKERLATLLVRFTVFRKTILALYTIRAWLHSFRACTLPKTYTIPERFVATYSTTDTSETTAHINANGFYDVTGPSNVTTVLSPTTTIASRDPKWSKYVRMITSLFDRANAYQEFNHPDIENTFETRHNCSERWDLFAPVLAEIGHGKMLDIGAATGYFCERACAETSMTPYALESNFKYLTYLKLTQKIHNYDFVILDRDIFHYAHESGSKKFTVALALSIFHHFVKSEALHAKLIHFLQSLDITYMVFQPHNPDEAQMQAAFKNYSNEEFIAFIKKHTGLTQHRPLGKEHRTGRMIYLIS